jgi:Cu2+-containing amine oxidase
MARGKDANAAGTGAAREDAHGRFVDQHLVADHPRRSIWVTQQKIAKTEREAQLHTDMMEPSLWRVISEGRKNAVGYPTS